MTLLDIPANRRAVRRTLAAAWFAALAFAVPLPGQTETVSLSLEEAIATALTENLGLRIEQLDTVVSEAQVMRQEAAFDTTLFGSGRLGESDADNFGVPETVILRDETGDPILDDDGNPVTVLQNIPTRSDNRSYSAGAAKRLRVTNSSLQIQTRLSRSAGSVFDERLGEIVGGQLREVASLNVSVTQPLLQGFGREIAEAPLERARAADRATQLQLRAAALDLIENTEQAYWNLATAEALLDVRQRNLKVAESIFEEVQERENLGLATALEVIQAQANLAQRQDDILVAEQRLQEAFDLLLIYLGSLESEAVPAAMRVEVEELPPAPGSLPQLSTIWQAALHQDPLVAAQAEVVAQREIDRRLAEDDRRPELDLTLAGEFSGRSDEDASEAFELLRDRDNTGWTIELGFSVPWGRRAATADLRAANARLEQAEWRLAQLKQELLRTVRTAHRELETRLKRLRTAELVLQLQEETFAQERTKLDEGLSTLRDVLEIQADLADARLALLDARASAILAEVRLERLRGTLLDRHGLSWSTALPGRDD